MLTISPSFFEATMLICFGLAWPASIYKTYISRTNQGKSIYFLYIILFGYLNGMIFQYLLQYHRVNYVFYIFTFNTLMVFIDIVLYYRNIFIVRLSINQTR